MSATTTIGARLHRIARVAHEANRAYCLALEEENPPASWDELSPEAQEGKTLGVKRVLQGASGEALHKAWADNLLMRGWRYGEVRDDERKEHPNLVPYKMLSEEQKRKDLLFEAVVKALL